MLLRLWMPMQPAGWRFGAGDVMREGNSDPLFLALLSCCSRTVCM
jgi:hypothetical protein